MYPLNGSYRYLETRYPKILWYLQYSHPLKYVTFYYLLPEINVHYGHNTDSFLKYVVKHDTHNNSVLNNLMTSENMIIGISQLYQIWGSVLTPHSSSDNSVEAVLL